MPRPKSRSEHEARLPLKPVETLLLTMLTGGDRHGYGLRQDVLAHTGGRIALEVGSLYRLLGRLEEEGLLAPVPPSEASRPGDDERRIYYRLTPLGRRVIAAEMKRLRSLVRLAESRRIIVPERP